MAGGEGTRLRPLTCGRPKPMVPIANKPVMEHIIDLLKRHKIVNVAATLQYMPDLISDYFGDGDSFGIKMRYYIEQKPLGTAGSVKNAEDFLDETFLVISGDALTDIDLNRAIAFHKDKRSFATLILKRVDVPLEIWRGCYRPRWQDYSFFLKVRLGRGLQRYCQYRHLHLITRNIQIYEKG